MIPDLTRNGATLIQGAALAMLDDLRTLAAALPSDRAGVRLHGHPALAPLLAPAGVIAAPVEAVLGPAARPVRAILFDKSSRANWSLGWHQDRTICVAARREVAGFGPWTIKQGLLHVEPPFAVIKAMLTVRVHLDPVDPDTAPLLVAPGSHRLGRVAEEAIAAAVETCGIAACLAEPGDLWLYATPILHASAVNRSGRHRRVLQVDFAAVPLPGGLAWLGT